MLSLSSGHFPNFRKDSVSMMIVETAKIVTKQVEAMYIELSRLNSLSEDASLDTLHGLSVCLVLEFKQTFAHQPNKREIDWLSICFKSDGDGSLDHIESILDKANQH